MGTSVSAILTVTTPSLGVAPGPALNLVTSNVTATSLTLAWSAPTTGTQPFQYQPQFQLQGDTIWTNFGSQISATTVTITGLTPSATYVFEVITTNGTGTSTSATSNPVTMLAAVPGPASNLVTSNVTATSLTLAWTAPVSGTQPFQYQPQFQLQGAASWTNFGGQISTTTVAITGLAPVSTYLFQVISSNSAGTSTSAPSNPVTTLAVAPGAPSGLAASSVTPTSFVLSWAGPAVGTPPFTYLVYQSPHGTNSFAQIAAVATTSTQITGLTSATVYDFEVFARNSIATGPASAALTVTTASVAPGAPSAPSVVGTPGTNSVSLSWSAPTVGNAPFIYQMFDATPSGSVTFAAIGPTLGSTSELITGLSSATSYDFQVTANNVAGTGPASPLLSNVVTASVVVVPSAPGNLAASSITTTTLTLSWTVPVSGTTPFTYLVFQSPSGANTFTQIASTGALSASVTGLTASTSYDFQVKASNTAGTSPASAAITATTAAPAVIAPGVPTGLTSATPAQTSITLSFQAPAVGTPPLTYGTRYSLTGLATWTTGPSSSSTTVQVTGLTAGTAYDFQVDASNTAGTSAFSPTYTASTAGSAAPTVTWQPTGATPTVSFSNANLTAAAGGSTTVGAAVQTCVSTSAVSSGNVAWEITLVAVTQNVRVGLATAIFSFTNQLGFGPQGVGFCTSTGTGSPAAQSIIYNNTALLTPTGGTPASDTAGDVLSFCLTIPSSGSALWWVTSPKMRATYGANAWNDSATATPATGTGGIALALTGPLLIAFNSAEGGGSATLNAGSSAFSFGGLPSNFIAWNGAAATTIAPGAPGSLAVGTITATTVALSWVAPTVGTPPFTYFVQQSAHGANSFTSSGSGTATSLTVTGLTSSTAYDFEVYASNAAGNGPNSAIVSATTASSLTVPGAPSALTVGTPGPNSIPLSWQPPTTGGKPTGYQVQYKLTTAGTYTKFATTVLPPQSITSASGGKITDNDSNVWTIVSGQVVVNGVADTTTSSVVTMTYASGLIWQENSSNVWWSSTISSGWAGGTTTGPVSPTQTITAGAPGKITDNDSNVWTITSGEQVALNGVTDTTSSQVIAMAFDGTLVWQQNAAGDWYSSPTDSGWTGGTTTGPVSPTKTVTTASGGSITDANGNVWTITSGAQVAVNGVADVTTSTVNTIAIASGVMWQKNTAGNWYSKTNVPAVWTGPSTGPTTKQQSITFSGSAGSITDARSNVWTINSALQVSLNGLIDTTTSKVVAIAIASGVIWYKNAALNWFSKTNPTPVWLPTAGTTTGPSSGLAQTITGLTSSTTYNFTVYAFNAAGNGAVSSPAVNGTTTALASNFSISGGKVIKPDGAAFVGRGVSVPGDQLSKWVTNAAGAPLTSTFKKINFVRVPTYSFGAPTSYQPMVGQLTALNIVVIMENHQSFNNNGSGSWDGPNSAGGDVGTIPTGSDLATEQNWYSALASAFKTNPYVWFGTCNEPSTSPSLAALSTWQQATYNTIRGAGNNNIVEMEQGVPSQQGAGNGMTASVYAAMKNIVFGPHYYAWIWNSSFGGSANEPQSVMYSTQPGTNNSPQGGIVQQVAQLQTFTSQDGTVPCGCFEFGNSTTGNDVDPGGMACVNAVWQAVTAGNLFGAAAWWVGGAQNGADQIMTDNSTTTSLTSPYGTNVAAAIATNT